MRNDVPGGAEGLLVPPAGVARAGGKPGTVLIEQLRASVRALEQVPVSLGLPPAPGTGPSRPACSLSSSPSDLFNSPSEGEGCDGQGPPPDRGLVVTLREDSDPLPDFPAFREMAFPLDRLGQAGLHEIKPASYHDVPAALAFALAALAQGDGKPGHGDLVLWCLTQRVARTLMPAHVLGCVAEGVVARDRELEDGPAVAVWAASLPDAVIETFQSVALDTDEGVAVTGIPNLDDADLVTLLVDPFTYPAGGFLSKLNEEEDSVPLVGGLAAGGGEPDSQALFCDGEVLYEGAVGAVLRGVPVRTVVSQGCEPIGRDSVITHAEENVVFELAGEPALERLKGDLGTLTPDQESSAARGGVLAGLVIDENRADYRRGDYLMRGLTGVDEERARSRSAKPCASARRCASTSETRPRQTPTCARTSRPRSTASGPRVR